MRKETSARADTPGWRWKDVLAATFCLSYLGIQLVVPVIQLGAPRPARFGWQMWAARRSVPAFVVLMKNGMRQPVAPSAHVGMSRVEIDLGEALPPHLCRVVAGIAAVEVRGAGSEMLQVHRCP